LTANWRANLQDFIMNQPFSIAISFVILWSVYQLQVVNTALVARLDALEKGDTPATGRPGRPLDGKAPVGPLEMSVVEMSVGSSESQKRSSTSVLFSSKKKGDKYAWGPVSLEGKHV
jgi:hypothetical protein